MPLGATYLVDGKYSRKYDFRLYRIFSHTWRMEQESACCNKKIEYAMTMKIWVIICEESGLRRIVELGSGAWLSNNPFSAGVYASMANFLSPDGSRKISNLTLGWDVELEEEFYFKLCSAGESGLPEARQKELRRFQEKTKQNLRQDVINQLEASFLSKIISVENPSLYFESKHNHCSCYDIADPRETPFPGLGRTLSPVYGRHPRFGMENLPLYQCTSAFQVPTDGLAPRQAGLPASPPYSVHTRYLLWATNTKPCKRRAGWAYCMQDVTIPYGHLLTNLPPSSPSSPLSLSIVRRPTSTYHRLHHRQPPPSSLTLSLHSLHITVSVQLGLESLLSHLQLREETYPLGQ
ncbi:predicted protein [Histoplasma capsulatum H143]|uniref:Uncharacterized protein n=1 Tax=Ajellomyces capsulatus (strain H143) TaxID=544712 RepID=C6HFS1_AJECH|nr:predicted protein [Histoplasma capsulatum H143]